MSTTITDEVLEQFNRTLAEFRDVVRKMPDEAWCEGTTNYLVPARLAYHILYYANLYVSDAHYTAYCPESQYEIEMDWDETPPEELPSREEVLTYIDQTEAAVKQWLLNLGDEGLVTPEDKYPWTSSLPLGRAIYGMRHILWHVGELNALLRERGGEQGAW